jgi:polysaccharide export outer membrane protein
VAWSIGSGKGKSNQAMSSTKTVAADGSLDLGPYGSVKVAGLTVDQARTAVERHLTSYLPSPQVKLQALANKDVQQASAFSVKDSPVPGVTITTWRPAVHLDEAPAEPIQGIGYRTEPNNLLTPLPPSLRGQAPSELRADALNMPSGDTTPLRPIPADNPPFVPPLAVGAPVVLPHHDGDVPVELNKKVMPPYIIEPPDILLIGVIPPGKTTGADVVPLKQPISGPHLVKPDGRVSLGIYGEAFVTGMTVEQAKASILAKLRETLSKDQVSDDNLYVDVLAYNSKVYYVVTDGGGYGEQVYRVPFTGNETVLDAIGQINGLPPVASKCRIWVARRAPGDPGYQNTLPVDWVGITQRAATATNYQIMPGDRVYVAADKWITTDSWVAKRLAPVERLLGVTLLGSSTVNSIRNRSGTSGSGVP